MNILLVCTGNTCRGALAEPLFEDEVDRSSKPGVKFDTAGTFALQDSEPTDFAVKVMKKHGYNIERHRAKQVDEELIEWADLILTMESMHIDHIEAMFPSAEGKMYTLMEYAYPGEELESRDIPDPYDEDMDEYEECVAILKDITKKIVRRLEGEN